MVQLRVIHVVLDAMIDLDDAALQVLEHALKLLYNTCLDSQGSLGQYQIPIASISGMMKVAD